MRILHDAMTTLILTCRILIVPDMVPVKVIQLNGSDLLGLAVVLHLLVPEFVVQYVG